MNDRVKTIKEIREKTNAPIMLIKQALDESKEAVEALDLDPVTEAIEWIKDNWKAKDKEAAFGRIYTYVHQGRIGVMIEMCCGTDFVANTDRFGNLCKELAYQVAAGLEQPLEEQTSIRDASKTVKDMIDEVSRETGESIKVGRYIRWLAGA